MGWAIRARLRLLACFLLASCGTEEPRRYAARSEAIIDGHACAADEQDATIALLGHFTLQSNGNTYEATAYVCSGVLIAPDTVLTAAHCVNAQFLSQNLFQNASVLDTRFFISRQDDLQNVATSPVSDEVNVSNVAAHPDFNFTPVGTNPFQRYSDLALLFLSTTESVSPAYVITPAEGGQVMPGATVEISGWGEQSSDPNPAPGSQGIKQCAETAIIGVGNYEMQVGGPSSPRQCHGDSGGPTYMNVETSVPEKLRVVGITSHSYDASECDTGAVDTKLTPYVGWIDQTMTDACHAGERVWCQTAGLPSPYGRPTKKKKGCGAIPTDLLAVLPLFLAARKRRKRPLADS